MDLLDLKQKIRDHGVGRSTDVKKRRTEVLAVSIAEDNDGANPEDEAHGEAEGTRSREDERGESEEICSEQAWREEKKKKQKKKKKTDEKKRKHQPVEKLKKWDPN